MAAATPVRADDWLVTPENAVITFIDYRPDQYAGVGSIGVDEMLVNVITPGQIATAYGLPVVLSTVAACRAPTKSCTRRSTTRPKSTAPRSTRGKTPTFAPPSKPRAARSSSWPGCGPKSASPSPLDALRAGYDVYVVEDAIGGVSPTAHHAAMRRMEQAGARPITVIGLAGELQRDWGRESADRLRAALGSYFGGHRGLKSGGRP